MCVSQSVATSGPLARAIKAANPSPKGRMSASGSNGIRYKAYTRHFTFYSVGLTTVINLLSACTVVFVFFLLVESRHRNTLVFHIMDLYQKLNNVHSIRVLSLERKCTDGDKILVVHRRSQSRTDWSSFSTRNLQDVGGLPERIRDFDTLSYVWGPPSVKEESMIWNG